MVRRIAVLVLVASCVTAARSQDVGPAHVENGGFEERVVNQADPVPGWTIGARARRAGYRVEVVGATGARALHVTAPTSVEQGAQAALFQVLDATKWRGKRVRLRARVRVDRPGEGTTLGLRIARPAPFDVGFFDPMTDRAVTEVGWRDVVLSGRVARDATTITIAVTVAGAGDATVDDVRLEDAPADTRSPSSTAARYLDRALAALRKHVNAAASEWPRIEAEARSDIGGASVASDVHAAIRGALGALGDRHARFDPPAVVDRQSAAADRPFPHSKALGRFGLIDLPRLDTVRRADLAFARTYADTVRTSLQALDGHVCGWIVDVRANSGGNVWPMIDGLRPLLLLPGGKQSGAEPAWDLHYPSYALTSAALPVAVLIGPNTASAGEAVALQLVGRPRTRIFGRQTAGFTTANETTDLPDGAALQVPVERMKDRNGRAQVGPIVPDEAADDAERAATQWLERQANSCIRR